MDVGGFSKVLMIELLIMRRLDPDLPQNVLKHLRQVKLMSEIYSGYLRLDNTIDSV